MRARSFAQFVCAALMLVGLGLVQNAEARRAYPTAGVIGTVLARDLPPEAQATLRAIQAGPPFPIFRDGSLFSNYEGALPPAPRGYYSEYTVRTPWIRGRGPRRIIAGAGLVGPGRLGSPRNSGQYWYTEDHYRTFRQIILR